MMTVKQVSELTGVSIRTLRYYDKIGLLSPSDHTEGGYRLYDDTALERLQQILLFRELEFPLKDIIGIMGRKEFDRRKALDQQIELLELKKQHLQKLIDFARGIKMLGVRAVDFTAFDRSKLDEYAQRAKAEWGDTPEYKEFEEKDSKRTAAENDQLTERFMTLFAEFGELKGGSPDSPEAQAQVRKLQSFITENMYTCTDEILRGLGKMYAAGGEFTENIDRAGGKGTAEFTAAAIEVCLG
ncbi:MerR family transcriptional regulator [Ruminococcus flavefaciens]|uniref:DNA-binding transcriptional MerR regulator n=1 Tax=Ruminococcus flavefaciens TaxID=1265 RepID=A0A315XZ68_RUMFL|nr:MerR family transcriptional regulator [Ruminococcus flavefaciens]PWJ13029.1 DNA-binding transcriptional MerR regulator [Ruminococcus flavefaciens]SSA48593.1 DNA-binding transcriptional regulator, MerR family [Ruminococcus flavefaciens]